MPLSDFDNIFEFNIFQAKRGLLTDQAISGQMIGLKINHIRRGGGGVRIGQKEEYIIP